MVVAVLGTSVRPTQHFSSQHAAPLLLSAVSLGAGSMRRNPLLRAGLPFMTLVVLGSFGLAHLLQARTCSTRRRAQ